jgi:oxygen-independent coproporphyrinogen-3 oxidase
MVTMTNCRALYVHVPFCRTLCGYCDFYSEVLTAGRAGPLVEALVRELDGYAARGVFERFDTIFVGGGTPTVLPPVELERLLRAIQAHAGPVEGLEFTVEANPATVTEEVAGILAAGGVNRVSIGAQSFRRDELRVLDRTHDPDDVVRTVGQCRRAGIGQVSLDLIFGIPGQSVASWGESLRAAVELGVQHLSCYGLTYEADTPLRQRRDAGRIQPVDEEVEAEMYELAIDWLAAAGLEQYEISNFARVGARCRHNLVYWHNEPYVGIGPAAAGFVGDVRYKNVADTTVYARAIEAGQSPWGEREQLPPARRAGETAMLELRLSEGIDRRRFAERYGQDPVLMFADAIARHEEAGLLAVSGTHVRLTRAGLLLANRVSADFV